MNLVWRTSYAISSIYCSPSPSPLGFTYLCFVVLSVYCMLQVKRTPSCCTRSNMISTLVSSTIGKMRWSRRLSSMTVRWWSWWTCSGLGPCLWPHPLVVSLLLLVNRRQALLSPPYSRLLPWASALRWQVRWWVPGLFSLLVWCEGSMWCRTCPAQSPCLLFSLNRLRHWEGHLDLQSPAHLFKARSQLQDGLSSTWRAQDLLGPSCLLYSTMHPAPHRPSRGLPHTRAPTPFIQAAWARIPGPCLPPSLHSRKREHHKLPLQPPALHPPLAPPTPPSAPLNPLTQACPGPQGWGDQQELSREWPLPPHLLLVDLLEWGQ